MIIKTNYSNLQIVYQKMSKISQLNFNFNYNRTIGIIDLSMCLTELSQISEINLNFLNNKIGD